MKRETKKTKLKNRTQTVAYELLVRVKSFLNTLDTARLKLFNPLTALTMTQLLKTFKQ